MSSHASTFQRFGRQLPLWGQTGQEQLQLSHVVVLGVSDTAVSAIKNLLLCGVGNITVVVAEEEEETISIAKVGKSREKHRSNSSSRKRRRTRTRIRIGRKKKMIFPADAACNYFFPSKDLYKFHQKVEKNAKEKEGAWSSLSLTEHSDTPGEGGKRETRGEQFPTHERESKRRQQKEVEPDENHHPRRHTHGAGGRRGIPIWSFATSLLRGPLGKLYPEGALRFLRYSFSLSQWGLSWADSMAKGHRQYRHSKREKKGKEKSNTGRTPCPSARSFSSMSIPSTTTTSSYASTSCSSFHQEDLFHLIPSLLLITRDYPDWSPLSPVACTAQTLRIPLIYLESHGWIGGWVKVSVETRNAILQGGAGGRSGRNGGGFFQLEKKKESGKGIEKIGDGGKKKRKEGKRRNKDAQASPSLPLITWRKGGSGGGGANGEEAIMDSRIFSPFPALRDWMEAHLPPSFSRATPISSPPPSPPFLLILYAAYKRWSENQHQSRGQVQEDKVEEKKTAITSEEDDVRVENKTQSSRDGGDCHEEAETKVKKGILPGSTTTTTTFCSSVASPNAASVLRSPMYPSSPKDFHELRLEVCAMFREQEAEAEKESIQKEEEKTKNGEIIVPPSQPPPRWMTTRSVREALAKCTPFYLQRSCSVVRMGVQEDPQQHHSYQGRRPPPLVRDVLFHPVLNRMMTEEDDEVKERKRSEKKNSSIFCCYGPSLHPGTPARRCREKKNRNNIFHGNNKKDTNNHEERDEEEEEKKTEWMYFRASLWNAKKMWKCQESKVSSSSSSSPPPPQHQQQEQTSATATTRRFPLPPLSSLHVIPYQRQILAWYLLFAIRAFYSAPTPKPHPNHSPPHAAASPYVNAGDPCHGRPGGIPHDGCMTDFSTTTKWEEELRFIYTQKHLFDVQWVVDKAWEKLQRDRGTLDDRQEEVLLEKEEGEGGVGKGEEEDHSQQKEGRTKKEKPLWCIPIVQQNAREAEDLSSPNTPSFSSNFCLFLFYISPAFSSIRTTQRKSSSSTSPSTGCDACDTLQKNEKKKRKNGRLPSFSSLLLYPPQITKDCLYQALYRLGKEMVRHIWGLTLIPNLPSLPSPSFLPKTEEEEIKEEEKNRNASGRNVTMKQEESKNTSKPMPETERSRSRRTVPFSSCSCSCSSRVRYWEEDIFPSFLRSFVFQHSFLSSFLLPPPASPPRPSPHENHHHGEEEEERSTMDIPTATTSSCSGIGSPVSGLSPESIDAFFAVLLLLVRELHGHAVRRKLETFRIVRRRRRRKKEKSEKHLNKTSSCLCVDKEERGTATERESMGKSTGKKRSEGKGGTCNEENAKEMREENTQEEERSVTVQESWNTRSRRRERDKEKQKRRWKKSAGDNVRSGWGNSPDSLLWGLHRYGALPSWISHSLFPSSSSSMCLPSSLSSSINFPDEKKDAQGGLYPSPSRRRDVDDDDSIIVTSGRRTRWCMCRVSFLRAAAREVWEQQQVEVPSVAAALGALAAQEAVKLLQHNRRPACGVDGIFYSGYSNTVRSWARRV